jgi:hypothetical protein
MHKKVRTFSPRPSTIIGHPKRRPFVVRGNHSNSNLAAQDAEGALPARLSVGINFIDGKDCGIVVAGYLYPQTYETLLVKTRQRPEDTVAA